MARAPRREHVSRITLRAPRQVSISKRRRGLFRKACELSALCDAESAVLVMSPGSKVFSLGDPDVNTVVDRFLDYATRQVPAPEAGHHGWKRGGAAMVSGAERGRLQPGGRIRHHGRRILIEELYRLHAKRESWLVAANARSEELMAGIREMQNQLPHRWAAKVEELELTELEEMTDALEDLAVRVSQVISGRQAQEGGPPDQRSSTGFPTPPSNLRHQAVLSAGLGREASWNPAGSSNDAAVSAGIMSPSWAKA